MELLTANNIIFVLLSAMVLLGGIGSVLTERLMHAAFYLFLTLVGIAGLYLQMSYDFLAAAQLSVYAGGIMVLFIFAIVLVHNVGEHSERASAGKLFGAGLAAFFGILVTLATIFVYSSFEPSCSSLTNGMRSLGSQLLSTGKHEFLLPFEASGILLLACIVGALVVANKRKEDNE